MLFIEGLKLTLGPLYSFHLRMHCEGEENVPEQGGGVLVANHRSYADPLVIGYCIERYVNFAAGSHLYAIPGTEQIFKLIGFFKMNIYGGEEGDQSLDEASRLLRDAERDLPRGHRVVYARL